MRPPRAFEIAKRKWRVFREGEEPAWLKRKTPMERRGILGVTFIRARVIVLQRGLRGWLLWVVLLHEVLHAVISELRARLGRRIRWLSHEREEELCEAADVPLAEALRYVRWRNAA